MAARSRKRKPISSAHAVTSGTGMRLESPASSRKPKPNPAVVMVREINPASGFLGFLREYTVVGLAVGFVIGTQAQGLVRLLASNFIDPAFQLLFGQALSQRTFVLQWHDRTASFGWGGFVYGLLNFLFVLAAIYIIVKFFKLDKLNKPKDGEVEEA